MNLMWILFSITAVLFVILFTIVSVATRNLPKIGNKRFALVYAGNPEEDEKANELEIPLSKFIFKDNEEKDVPIDDYDGYIAKGNSMELANIKNGDLMLVSKNYKFQDDTPLPNIFILKREHVIDETEAKFKLRRVWAIVHLNEATNLEDVIKGIKEHPVFNDLQNKTDYYLSTEQMENEFFDLENGRFSIYKKEHPRWNDINHEDSRVIISTTLRNNHDQFKTKSGKHISFSIHPANLVVGAVAYTYPGSVIEDVK